ALGLFWEHHDDLRGAYLGRLVHRRVDELVEIGQSGALKKGRIDCNDCAKPNGPATMLSDCIHFRTGPRGEKHRRFFQAPQIKNSAPVWWCVCIHNLQAQCNESWGNTWRRSPCCT